MRFTHPADGTRLVGRPVNEFGQRIAKIRVAGTADPEAAVFVAGNGDGGRSDDWTTVESDADGRWRARVNVIGCRGARPVVTAEYDEAYADQVTVRLRFDCGGHEPGRTGSAAAPPQGSCDEIPARNFPVPPGDARDADGDGIACET